MPAAVETKLGEVRQQARDANAAPDREIGAAIGSPIKKGAAEIAVQDQDHVPEEHMLTMHGHFTKPATSEMVGPNKTGGCRDHTPRPGTRT